MFMKKYQRKIYEILEVIIFIVIVMMLVIHAL